MLVLNIPAVLFANQPLERFGHAGAVPLHELCPREAVAAIPGVRRALLRFLAYWREGCASGDFVLVSVFTEVTEVDRPATMLLLVSRLVSHHGFRSLGWIVTRMSVPLRLLDVGGVFPDASVAGAAARMIVRLLVELAVLVISHDVSYGQFPMRYR